MSIQAETRQHVISSAELNAIVNGPEAHTHAELDVTSKKLVGAIAIREGYFYNPTLRVFTPLGSTEGMTTSDDPQIVGVEAGYKYDTTNL